MKINPNSETSLPTPSLLYYSENISYFGYLEKFVFANRDKSFSKTNIICLVMLHRKMSCLANIQNYIAIFSEEDPLYRTHNSEIGNIRFLDCDHVTAKYL